jgi:peptidylprolyl isomerase
MVPDYGPAVRLLTMPARVPAIRRRSAAPTLTKGMRRCVAAVALLLAAGTLAGCGGDPGPVPGVTGSFGTDPVITIPNGSPSADLVVQTLIQGRGPVVDPADYVLFNVEGKVWAGDREVVDSFTDRQPQGLPLASAIPAWRHLAGQRVGSRVLMVVPPRYGFGRQGDPQANIMGTDTLVFVFDVVGAVRRGAHAEGTAVAYRPGPGRPAISWRASGPVITVPSKAAPPKNLVSQLLIRGHGRPILNGQTIVAQYSGIVWSSGKVFDSSWQRGFPESFVLGTGQVLAGWEQGLGGVPVGSRVMLIIPPSLGYGQSGDPPDVGSNSTTVFVIDILAAV